jgi:hypothetical protein
LAFQANNLILVLYHGGVGPLEPCLPAGQGPALALQAITKLLDAVLALTFGADCPTRGPDYLTSWRGHAWVLDVVCLKIGSRRLRALDDLELDAAVLKGLLVAPETLPLRFQLGFFDGIHLKKAIQMSLIAPEGANIRRVD